MDKKIISIDKSIMEQLDKEPKIWVTAAFTAVCMLMCHGYAFLRPFFTHDALWGLFISQDDLLVFVGQGRWFTPVFMLLIQGTVESPAVIGLLAVGTTAAAAALTVRIFRFNTLEMACCSLIMSVNLVWTAQIASYMPWCGVYGTCLLLNVTAAWLILRAPARRGRLFASVVCMVLSLGMYQPYIGVTAGLLIIYMLRQILEEKPDWRSFFRRGFGYVLPMAAAVVVYVLIMKLVFALTGIPASEEYNGPGALRELTAGKVALGFLHIYYDLFCYYFKISSYLTLPVILCNAILILAGLCPIYRRVFSTGEKRLASQALLLLFLLPLGMGCTELISMYTHHILMFYGFNLLLFLPLAMGSLRTKTRRSGRDLKVLLAVCFLVLGWNCTVYSNGAYLTKELIARKTGEHMSAIWKDVNSLPEYQEGVTPVVFAGDPTRSAIAYTGPLQEKYGDLQGFFSAGFVYPDAAREHLQVLQGTKMLLEAGIPASDRPIVQKMPCYPKEGYIFLHDGRIIVKLAD